MRNTEWLDAQWRSTALDDQEHETEKMTEGPAWNLRLATPLENITWKFRLGTALEDFARELCLAPRPGNLTGISDRDV